jgi:hypothetical protein
LRGASCRDSVAFGSRRRGDSRRPKERRDSGQTDLLRARLDQIVDMGHPLAKLARAIDWRFLEERFGAASHKARPSAAADAAHGGAFRAGKN